jgi:pimeloyl-ACP methyl ester carboxylesterase
MKVIKLIFLLLTICTSISYSQKMTWKNQEFEAKNVTASLTQLNGEAVIKVERDLTAIPFDVKKLGATVDEPTYVKLKNVSLDNGTIEVKMLSQIQNPSPFQGAQGFIGVAFRIDDQDKAYESIYLRPKVGRSNHQFARNKTVQYYSYPDYKFDKLRKDADGKYETTAPVDINEWITMRIEVNGVKATMFINDAKYSTFVVDTLKGKTTTGSIGLWVDIGTIGYFKDLKITPLQKPVKDVQGQTHLRRAFQPSNVVYTTPYGNNPEAGRYVQAKDAKIYYEVYGKGQPIVLLHGGLFGSTVEMTEFIEKLKETNQIIAISTRGHGKSELGKDPLTLEQRATDAMAVINAVTKDSVMVIGFSDGGYAAYQLAAMYPNRVKKMVVIGAGELRPGLRAFNFTAKQAMDMDKPFMEQQLKLMPEPNRLEEMFAGVCTCYNQLTVGKKLLGAIQCPVLVMAGDNDGGNPVERVVSAARMIPKHQISIISNTGHGCFLEHFEAAWASIVPFLK